MSSYSARDIVLRYIKHKMNQGQKTFKSHEFQSDVQSFGTFFFKKLYSPSTYNRQWRAIRSNKEYKVIGIADIVKEKHPTSKETIWKILKD